MALLLVRESLRLKGNLPSFDRESITWRSVGQEVELSILLKNDSFERTEADTLVIEAAAFGAFIPTEPVVRIAVGAMDPGEERTFTTRIPMGDLPRTDYLPPSSRQLRMLREFVESRGADAAKGWITAETGLHWIGNFNVYFDRDPEQAVERHVAFGLKVPKSCVVVGMFFIDALEVDAKASSTSADWKVEVNARYRTGNLFVKSPDRAGERAHVGAEITRLQDRATVLVEFEFETTEGWGDTVGCVPV